MKAQLRDQGWPRIGFYSNTSNFVFDIKKKIKNWVWFWDWCGGASREHLLLWICITLEPNSFDKLIVIMGNEGFEPWMSSLGTPRSVKLSYPPGKLFFQTKFFNPIWSSFELVQCNTHTHTQKKVILTFRVRLVGGLEKWEDRKYLVFSHMCLVERMEKMRDRKLWKMNLV